MAGRKEGGVELELLFELDDGSLPTTSFFFCPKISANADQHNYTLIQITKEEFRDRSCCVMVQTTRRRKDVRAQHLLPFPISVDVLSLRESSF